MTTKKSQPVLIYDGECDFCIYWVKYWERLTGNHVSYHPYQEVASEYPSISIPEFQRAVQYVSPKGKISSGAEASFLTLSHAPYQKFWLWLYQKIPGFAWCSEKIYTFISTHRSFFYKLSLFLWGKQCEPSHYDIVSWLFLRALGVIFLFAFVSFGLQASGLIGSQGMLPIQELVTAGEDQLTAIRYWLLPMVFWINASDLMIQFICWGGAALSLSLILNRYPRTCLLLLYVFYLSLVTAGRDFMAFQWDAFLLETGILSIFLLSSQSIGIWLLRWLLFRFVFAAGLVKILSGDFCWHDFTALSYYFNTEPLPTSLAWYANLLPSFVLKGITFISLFIELVIPFLIFFPRRLRFFSGFCILIMQFFILITGNYNFFNLLTILLCLTLFDDQFIQNLLPQSFIDWITQQKQHYKLSTYIVYPFAIVTILLSLVQFQLRFTGSAPMPLVWMNNTVAPLHVVNQYGPFAVITKERMEIVIEGSDDGINWKEYTFKYKPGDVYRKPPWNIPFQPRLDWQMWFAALAQPEDSRWFIRLVQRILEGSPAVLDLLGYNPFPDKPPLYLRAQYYEYHFTTMEERRTTGAWWERRLVKRYFP